MVNTCYDIEDLWGGGGGSGGDIAEGNAGIEDFVGSSLDRAAHSLDVPRPGRGGGRGGEDGEGRKKTKHNLKFLNGNIGNLVQFHNNDANKNANKEHHVNTEEATTAGTHDPTPAAAANSHHRCGRHRQASVAHMIPVRGCYVHGDTYRTKFRTVCQLDEARSHLIQEVEEPNMLKIVFTHWTGTILNEIIYDLVFWLTLVLYTGLRLWIQLGTYHHRNRTMSNMSTNATTTVVASFEEVYEVQHTTTNGAFHEDDDGTLPPISSSPHYVAIIGDNQQIFDSLPIVGGFLTLFLVFFVDQNHERYYTLHDATMLIMGKICNLSAMLTSSTKLPIEHARRINRYANTAQVVMYAGLSTYFQDGCLVENFCRDYRLLTYHETQRLEQCGLYQGKASACFELLSWCLQDINRALQQHKLDSYQALEMRHHITEIRSTINEILVLCLCPIPFFYVHFLSLLTAVYLPMFALMVAFKTGTYAQPSHSLSWYATEGTGFFLVFLQCIFLIGLRILGQQLGNPYGDDFIDIQVTTYIVMTLSTSNRILEATDINDVDGDVNPERERYLRSRMVDLGEAWNTTTIKHSPRPGVVLPSLSATQGLRTSTAHSFYRGRGNTNTEVEEEVPSHEQHERSSRRFESSQHAPRSSLLVIERPKKCVQERSSQQLESTLTSFHLTNHYETTTPTNLNIRRHPSLSSVTIRKQNQAVQDIFNSISSSSRSRRTTRQRNNNTKTTKDAPIYQITTEAKGRTTDVDDVDYNTVEITDYEYNCENPCVDDKRCTPMQQQHQPVKDTRSDSDHRSEGSQQRCSLSLSSSSSSLSPINNNTQQRDSFDATEDHDQYRYPTTTNDEIVWTATMISNVAAAASKTNDTADAAAVSTSSFLPFSLDLF